MLARPSSLVFRPCGGCPDDSLIGTDNEEAITVYDELSPGVEGDPG